MSSNGIPSGPTTQVVYLTEEETPKPKTDLKAPQSKTLPERKTLSLPAVTQEIIPADRGVMARFLQQPTQFTFDAAVLLMLRSKDAGTLQNTIRFSSPRGTAYPITDITAVQKKGDVFQTTITPVGLTGPTGVLPLHYTIELTAERRRRTSALSDFLELLTQRPLIHYAESSIKYRLASSHTLPCKSDTAKHARQISKVLLSVAGFQTPEIARSMGVNSDTVKFYSGYFSSMPRSAERLKALLSDWLNLPVTLEEFTPLRIKIEPDQQSRLPVSGHEGEGLGQFSQLGVDATIGERYLDYQSQFTVRIGALDLQKFQALTPAGELFKPLINMVRTFTGAELQIIIRPVLKKEHVPSLRLPEASDSPDTFQPRLGWNSWLTPLQARKKDSPEAVFTE